MKDSTKNKVKGAFHEAKGAAKEAAGKLTNDPALEVEGSDEKTIAKIQKLVGKVQKAVGG